MTIELINATGSEYYVPASGGEFRVNPVARVEARVTGVTRPSGSGNIGTFTSLQPSDQSLLVRGYGQSWTDDNTVFLKHQVWVGGANFGPGDLVRSCSLEINDSVVSGSAPVYLRYQPLNGSRTENVNGTSYPAGVSSVDVPFNESALTCSVFYWGIDDPSNIITPTVDSVWSLVGQTPVSSSGDRRRIDYYFTGSQNYNPSPRTSTIHFQTSNALRAWDSDSTLAVTQAAQGPESFDFTFLSGTGSNQYQPASGTYPSLGVSIKVENYSGSNMSQPSSGFTLDHPSGMQDLGRSVQWLSDSTIFNYSFAGGPNYGPGDRFLSGSLRAVPSDYPTVSDTFHFTVQQEQLNGCSFVSVPETLEAGTTKFSCSVFYWGIDDYSQVLPPEVGSGSWIFVNEGVQSASMDPDGSRTFLVAYHFTGSRNGDPGSRTQDIVFSCSTPRKSYTATLPLQVTQAGQGYPTDLCVTSDFVQPRITISSPTEGTLYKNGEVIMEDIFYPKPDGTSASLNLADLARPYVETHRGLGGNTRWYPDNFRYEDSNGTEVGPVAIIAGTATPYTVYDWTAPDPMPEPVFRLLSPQGDNMKFAPFGPVQGTLFNCSESPQQIKVGINNRTSQVGTITIEPGQIYTPRRNATCHFTDVEIWHETLGTLYKWTNRVDDATYTLYWVNAWGGISSYPFTGKVVRVETLERYNIINPRLYKYNYKNGVETRYRLSTGLLWDETSLGELFSSAYVYLYSRYPGSGVTGDVWIDANTIEYKTFKNQGRVVPEYEFEVVACRQKEVR